MLNKLKPDEGFLFCFLIDLSTQGHNSCQYKLVVYNIIVKGKMLKGNYLATQKNEGKN